MDDTDLLPPVGIEEESTDLGAGGDQDPPDADADGDGGDADPSD